MANDGGRTWGSGGGWRDGTPDNYPDWLQVDFNGSKTIDEVVVYSVKDLYYDPTDPTANETFSVYGVTDFNVQYWNGSNWTNVPNGVITNNNKVITRITFAPVTTAKIRVVVNSALAGYSRIVELEAWSGGAAGTVSADSDAGAQDGDNRTFVEIIGEWLSDSYTALTNKIWSLDA